MAIVQNINSKESRILFRQHSVGRDSNNICVINKKQISRKHAVIFWDDEGWKLEDFSSSGTKLNTKIVNNSVQLLQIDDLIQFSDSQHDQWKVINLDEPRSFLKALDEREDNIILDKEGIILMNRIQNFFVFLNAENRWVLDNEDRELLLNHGRIYLINGLQYRFIENECLTKNLFISDLTKNAHLQVFISAEDSTEIHSKIYSNDVTLDLGSGIFNVLLLELIRIKEENMKNNVHEDLCGWIAIADLQSILAEKLNKEISVNYINTLIYRIRKELMDLPPHGFLFANIIERKKGKIRLGFPKFQVHKEVNILAK